MVHCYKYIDGLFFSFQLIVPQSEEEQKQDASFSHGRPVGSSD